MEMWREIFSRMAALVTVGLLFASPAGAQTKLTGVYTAGHISVLPLLIAKDQGFLAKRGIDLDLRYVQAGSQPMSALLSGDVQLYIGTGDGITARLAGADVLYVMGFTKVAAWGVWTPGNSPIKTMADLKGKRIGVVGGVSGSARSSVEFLLLQAQLKIDDVRYVQMASAATTLTALETGALEAGTLIAPEAIKGRASGMRLIGMARDHGWESVGTSLSVMADYLKKNRDLVKRLIEADMEGIAVTQKDPTLAKRILKAADKADDDKLIEELFGAFQSEYLIIPEPPSAKAFQDVLNHVVSTFPNAATTNPAVFADRTLVEEIAKSGFADKLK